MRHENTIVYQKCLELIEVTREAIDQFPRGFAFLVDQLRRSSSSPVRNFAEGYYQDSKKQQRRYFGYAIQSARETSASFDSADAFGIIREDTAVRGKALALEIVRILSKFPTGQRRHSRPRRSKENRLEVVSSQERVADDADEVEC